MHIYIYIYIYSITYNNCIKINNLNTVKIKNILKIKLNVYVCLCMSAYIYIYIYIYICAYTSAHIRRYTPIGRRSLSIMCKCINCVFWFIDALINCLNIILIIHFLFYYQKYSLAYMLNFHSN